MEEPKKYILSERTDLFEPNVYISVIVSYSGGIANEKLMAAVQKAYTLNESTMSKIVLTQEGDAYYEKMDHSGCSVAVDERDYQTVIRENERKTFAIWEGEMIRAFILPGKEQSQLLIMAHHLVGDGQSILLLIQMIADLLAGHEVPYRPLELVDVEKMKKEVKMPLYIHAFIRSVNRKWKKHDRTFTWEDYRRIHQKYWDELASYPEVESLPIEEVRALCPEGVTINSTMIAKIASTYPQSKKVGIPLSFRGDNTSMSNQTSGFQISYTYRKNRSFADNAREVHRKIQKCRNNTYQSMRVLPIVAMLTPTLVDGVLMSVHGLYPDPAAYRTAVAIGYAGDDMRYLGITNLMKVETMPESPEFVVKDILFIPPKVSYSVKIFGIISYEGVLHIVNHEMQKRK